MQLGVSMKVVELAADPALVAFIKSVITDKPKLNVTI